jgi:hypothetical protein
VFKAFIFEEVMNIFVDAVLRIKRYCHFRIERATSFQHAKALTQQLVHSGHDSLHPCFTSKLQTLIQRSYGWIPRQSPTAAIKRRRLNLGAPARESLLLEAFPD